MTALFSLIRPKHWIKNVFVFIPVVMSGQALSINNILDVMALFVAFSLAASSVYILNDYRDIDKDKNHPVKKNRSLASGQIKLSSAFFALFIFVILILLISFFFLNLESALFLCAYLFFNICYSFGLKNIALIDVSIISLGFILRVCGGAAIIYTQVSFWLISMTFTLSMMLALGKRHFENSNYTDLGTRNTLSQSGGYSLKFTENGVLFFSISTFIFYCLYINNSFAQNYFIYFSMIIVAIGLMRYLQLFFSDQMIEEPTHLIFQDMTIFFTAFIWFIFIFTSIYLI